MPGGGRGCSRTRCSVFTGPKYILQKAFFGHALEPNIFDGEILKEFSISDILEGCACGTYVIVILSSAYGQLGWLNNLTSAINDAHEELIANK